MFTKYTDGQNTFTCSGWVNHLINSGVGFKTDARPAYAKFLEMKENGQLIESE